jgi:hypothetical protein
MTESHDSLAIGLCTRDAPIICQEKKSNIAVNMLCIINTCAFPKVNKLSKEITIIADIQNVSLLLLKNSI